MRIAHLVIAVVVSAFVIASSMFPQVYALLMVATAGVLMIGTCVVVAIVQRARDRRAKLERRTSIKRAGLGHPV